MNISIIFNGIEIFGAMLIALLFCLAVLAAFRSIVVGVVGAGLLVVLDASFSHAPYIQIGLQIYPGDLISLTIGAAAFARVVAANDRPRIPRSWLLFVAVLLVSFIQGIAAYGTTGGQAFRGYFYAIAIATYMMTFSTNKASLQRVIGVIGYLGLILTGIVIVRWLAVILHIGALLPEGGRFASSEASELRVNNSEDAIIIGDLLLAALFFPRSSAIIGKARPLLPALALVIVVLQHRSVWLAVLAGVVTRFVLPTENKKARRQLAALLLAIVVVVVPIALSGRGESTSAEISQSADRALALSDTAQARFQTWQWVFNKWRGGGPVTILTGLPFGTSMERVMLDGRGEVIRASFSPHNYFVQTLFVSGILGLGASIYLFGWLLINLYQFSRKAEHAETSALLFVLIAVEIVFYIPYGMHFFQCMLLGLAVAYIQTSRRQISPAQGRSALTRHTLGGKVRTSTVNEISAR